MKKNLLEAKMKEREVWYNDISNLLGIKHQALMQKVNGKRPIRIDEIKIISDYLKLTTDDIINIFFNELKVNETFTGE